MDGSDNYSTEPLLRTGHGGSDGQQTYDLKGGRFRVDSEGYSYAYGPQGYAGLLRNSYALSCAVFASIGGLTFGKITPPHLNAVLK
jgi:hypothetical protein